MNKDIVLKFCVSYLNYTVHLCMNFYNKILYNIGWSQMGYVVLPSQTRATFSLNFLFSLSLIFC